MKYSFKDFKRASKKLMNYENKSKIGKLIFNIKMPIKYLQLKRLLKHSIIVKGDDVNGKKIKSL